MALKNIAGVAGNVALPTGFAAKLSAWSGTLEIQTEEVTGFDSGGCDEHEPIGTAFSGSATGTGTYDASSTTPILGALADGSVLALGDLEGAKGTITLTAITGCTYAFTGIMTSVAMERPAKGKFTITFNFLRTGPMTQTWDVT